VDSYIKDNLIPVEVHIQEPRAVFDRFAVQWTPTLLFLDPQGTERYRFQGFLPPEDFLSHLELGVAHTLFGSKNFKTAEQRFRQIVERDSKCEVTPEALYWAGVSKYKSTGDPSSLAETASEFRSKYPETIWAKKASVWAKHYGQTP
jgi:thioredoxin-related protein